MSNSTYTAVSVLTGATSEAFFQDEFSSSLAVQIVPSGTARVELSFFANPIAGQWEAWLYGDVTAIKSAEFSPAVKAIRIVSVSGAVSAAISSLGK